LRRTALAGALRPRSITELDGQVGAREIADRPSSSGYLLAAVPLLRRPTGILSGAGDGEPVCLASSCPELDRRSMPGIGVSKDTDDPVLRTVRSRGTMGVRSGGARPLNLDSRQAVVLDIQHSARFLAVQQAGPLKQPIDADPYAVPSGIDRCPPAGRASNRRSTSTCSQSPHLVLP
jgi:hypothetical protein